MSKSVELPLVEPLYGTYHHQGPSSAIIQSNPSIRNWFLNHCMFLTCTRRFIDGYTSPEISVHRASWKDNLCLEKIRLPMQFLKGHVNSVIRNFIDEGYYVFFGGVDDYYVKGKSWYKQRHFSHDGLICGYNQLDKTYCIYAYDSNWIYRKFWTPQKCFEQGRRSMFNKGNYGHIVALKAKEDIVEFSPGEVLERIASYNESTLEHYPENVQGTVWGTVVHEYIAKYIDMLHNGSIPYERMDSRIFRMVWEHKKVMLEIIQRIEASLGLDDDISTKYQYIVSEANNLRMLYASYHMRRRDSILPVIKKRLLVLKEKEQTILNELLVKAGGANSK